MSHATERMVRAAAIDDTVSIDFGFGHCYSWPMPDAATAAQIADQINRALKRARGQAMREYAASLPEWAREAGAIIVEEPVDHSSHD